MGFWELLACKPEQPNIETCKDSSIAEQSPAGDKAFYFHVEDVAVETLHGIKWAHGWERQTNKCNQNYPDKTNTDIDVKQKYQHRKNMFVCL